ncbi:FAD-dependent oxidoreductase [Candidatus Rariloculus sp.]|uniref:FAD-dependent oxidoreductase n=1 Tax=Candidatus Rariloculus sp. TaxID=3101265 RepID=UPI003D135D57
MERKVTALYGQYSRGDMSRRVFLGHLAQIAGGTAAALTMLPALEAQAQSRAAAQTEPLSDLACDVLVLGGGLAGSAAAVVAAQNGANVVLLDKSPDVAGGNSVMTSGFLYFAGRRYDSPPAELYDTVMANGVAHPDLAMAWAENCSLVIPWLLGCGVSLRDGEQGGALEPVSEIGDGPVYRKDTGTKTLNKLRNCLTRHGGVAMTRVEAVSLIRENGRVRGVIARRGQREASFRARSTVLTAGGFSNNKEMLRQHVGPGAPLCKLRGSVNSTGDSLRMALEVDAKAVNLKYFYGHLLSLNALTDDRFWPFPRVDGIVSNSGILVDRQGNRFADEHRDGDIGVTNDLGRSNDPLGASLIFDQEAWDSVRGNPDPARPGEPAPNPWLLEKDGGLHIRPTAEQLAESLGIDRFGLARTIETFNRQAETGNFTGVPRSGSPRPLRGPLYGLKVVPGITFTMGGPLVNGRSQVLNAAEEPIPGLFAGGDAIGGLMGGYNGGYTGGVTQALTTGMLAGKNAAALSREA